MADQILLMREEDMPYQPISIASMEWNQTGNWRYLRPRFENKVSPCNEGCPAGQDIEGAMVLIGKGKIPGSLGAFQRGKPFSRGLRAGLLPSLRIFLQPGGFRRSRFPSTPWNASWPTWLRSTAEESPGKGKSGRKKSPSIGSGPAGLTCAYHLARMGYGVTVFEALPVLGGMLRVGIPEYRLPKKILEEEIDQILELGVNAEINTRLGGNLALNDLKEYSGPLSGHGKPSEQERWGSRAKRRRGSMSGVEFLRNVSLGKEVALGKRVAVIGGGNTAIDAARSALRLGAKPFILYRRTREEMPAFPAEDPGGRGRGDRDFLPGLPGTRARRKTEKSSSWSA